MDAEAPHRSTLSSRGLVEELLSALPSVSAHHSPGSKLYALLKAMARVEVQTLFSDAEASAREFGPFGKVVFPYHKMGAVDSIDLFGLDELIIFSYYWSQRHKYRRVLDIGANIGLHSILLSKCGYEVRAYEPDPRHYETLRDNLARNHCTNVQAVNAAVSSKSGVQDFVRVVGNTTSSHLAGSKPNPYGELETFPVPVEAVVPLIAWADLIKLDAEGHEKKILLSTAHDHWKDTDAFVEVGSDHNAKCIYEHFKNIGVPLFSQKTNWGLVRDPDDMPTSYRDGSLFVTMMNEMPWN